MIGGTSSARTPNRISLMTNATALLRAIRETPEDDLPRLAYADWLEESGDGDGKSGPRAEFIRVQVELARTALDSPHFPDLRRREAELLEDHKATWVSEEMPAGISVAESLDGRGFRRGFPADAWCPLDAF